MYTLGADFGETIADMSQLNSDQLNNRTIAESIATYSNYRASIRLLVVSDAANNTGKRVRSATISGSFLKVLNLSPIEHYTFVSTDNVLDVNFGRMNHDYFYIRCAQSKNERACMREGSPLHMSDLLAVVPCNYGRFIY